MANELASWSEGPSKANLLAFIRSVTTPGDGYVPPAQRIATFDNDGTLWCEKPLYVQADFILRRWAEMVRADPSKASEQPYKAVAERDRAWLSAVETHIPELVKEIAEASAGSPPQRSRRSSRSSSQTSGIPRSTGRTPRPAIGQCESCSTSCGPTTSGCSSARAAAATSCA